MMTLIDRTSGHFELLQARRTSVVALLAAVLAAAGCSSLPPTDPRDKFESVNRKVFDFNMGLDTLVLEPTADLYRKAVPQTARTAVGNQLEWVSRPSTVVNSTAQGEIENAGLAALDFLVNGLTLGLVDLSEDDKPIENEDFDDTLAHYNVPEGSYLMVPVLGPSTTRSLAASVVDIALNPLGSVRGGDEYSRLRTPVAAINFRANAFEAFNDVKYNSIDPYARTRSLFYQTRGAGGGRPGSEEEELASDEEFDAFFEETGE